jgi:ADP-ribose pyrophosphatase YjhB (NUDIX family)
MELKKPEVAVDILVIKNNQVLLGLLSKKWLMNGIQVYGVPGRDVRCNEKISDTVKRNIQDDIGCTVISYKIFSVNASHAFNEHYINIGVVVEIDGKLQNLNPEDWERWDWFDLSDIPINIFPSAKNAINCYLNKTVCISE